LSFFEISSKMHINLQKKVVQKPIQYNFAPGEMAEWSIAAVLKTVEVNSLRGFESLSLRQKASQQLWLAFCVLYIE
jgi:hypothetical protein